MIFKFKKNNFLNIWLFAIASHAYQLYTETEIYKRRLEAFSVEIAVKKYIQFEVLDFWKLAWKKNWLRILFVPYSIKMHPDLILYAKKNNNTLRLMDIQ